MEELASPQSKIGPSMAAVYGPAGRGKTMAAHRTAVHAEAIYIPPLNIRTPFGMLRSITNELQGVKPGTAERCIDLIHAEMQRRRRVIIIDEAEMLELRVIEMLRNLNEIISSPIVLVGERELKQTLAKSARLQSRIRRAMAFDPISQADIKLYYKRALDQELDALTVKMLSDDCGGDWRPMITRALEIERVMRSSGINAIAADLVSELINREQG